MEHRDDCIRLPSAATIHTALKSVLDDSRVSVGMYPLISKYADKTRNRHDVGVIVTHAIGVYSESFPDQVATRLYLLKDSFVQAIISASRPA